MQTISIHAPHTGRDNNDKRDAKDKRISIHAPHTGRDQQQDRLSGNGGTFQSTRPIRGATPLISRMTRAKQISIHAPHTGRDAGAACPRS